MWECVDLFRPPVHDEDQADDADPIDVLMFSAWDSGVTHYPLYWTGRYRGDTFEPRELHRLDYGGRYFYAPQSFQDDSGRRLVFGWLQEGRSDEAMVAAGWSGVMSLPRVVTLGADGALMQAPAPEVAALRGDEQTWAAQQLSVEPLPLGDVDQRDLELVVALAPGATMALTLAASADGEEVTVLCLSRSLDPTREVAVTRPDATSASVSAVTGAAELCSATTWSMRDTWGGPRPLYP